MLLIGAYEGIEMITTARVPIIKLKHKERYL
jgi:DNA polymerase sigma